MTTLYLAGPMTGIENLNFPLFNSEAARLRALGYTIVNPAEINGGADEVAATSQMTAEQYQQHWRSCMRRDVAALMTCDGIALLPGYEKSKGANIELALAGDLGMPHHMAADLVDRVANFGDMDDELAPAVPELAHLPTMTPALASKIVAARAERKAKGGA